MLNYRRFDEIGANWKVSNTFIPAGYRRIFVGGDTKATGSLARKL